MIGVESWNRVADRMVWFYYWGESEDAHFKEVRFLTYVRPKKRLL